MKQYKVSIVALSFFLSASCTNQTLTQMEEISDMPHEIWNNNPTFEGSPSLDWHRRAYAWSPNGPCLHGLSESEFWGEGFGGARAVYLGSPSGCFGVVTYRTYGKGWFWKTGWKTELEPSPKPLKVSGHRIVLSVKFRRLKDGYESWLPPGHIMYAANIWLRSPELKKPIVLDVVFDVGVLGRWKSRESEHAYHYQFSVWNDSNAWRNGLFRQTKIGQWYSVELDLSKHISRAVKFFDIRHSYDTLELEQAEMLVELYRARAAFEVSYFAVLYEKILHKN